MVMIMILADKITLHRKNAGWSQEEFAFKMKVSRQAVSKWEQAQSTPELDKILLMAKLFGVSTDYLLIDEIEEAEFTTYDETSVRRISLQEANEYLDVSESTRKLIGIGVSLCIVSPIPIILLAEANEALGAIILLLVVALAVFLFIVNGLKLAKYSYLEKEVFELEYGVESMTTQKMDQYQSTYITLIASGVILCILSVIPIFIGDMMEQELLSVAIFLGIVACGIYILVSNQLRWSAYKKLLQQGDYNRAGKKASNILEPIAGVYWVLVTAIYLIGSFTSNSWHLSWIIWPVAGLIFGAISIIVTALTATNNR